MSITGRLAKRIANYNNQGSIGSRFRKRRIAPLLEMIESAFQRYGHVEIIDLGGRENYWGIIPSELLVRCKVKITLVNYQEVVSVKDDVRFSFVQADACCLNSYENDTFHIAHSNSVIEHVGDWDRMVKFAAEVSRVSKNYFVQTPNFWFPVEPHCMTPFFHWLPKPTRIWLVMRFQLGNWRKSASIDEAVRRVESARLLNKKMFRTLFPDAVHRTEHFLFFPKSFIAVRHAS